MNRHIYAIAGLGILITTVSISSTKIKVAPAPPAGSNVTVTNGTANPVPTVNMGGTVSVTTVPPITISGTPNVNVNNAVNLANGTTVKVDSSTPLNVHDSSTPANRAYVHNFATGTINVNQISTNITLYTVPAGKELLVKDTYMFANGPTGQAISDCYLLTNPSTQLYPIAPTFMGQDSLGQNRFQGGATNTSMIVPAGGTLQLVVARNNSANSLYISCGFNGVLEDAS